MEEGRRETKKRKGREGGEVRGGINGREQKRDGGREGIEREE